MTGKENTNLHHIDIDESMCMGAQLNMIQREELIKDTSEEEIKKELDGIGDLKSPGMDGFGSKFFKACWHIVKVDVIAAVREFFDTGQIFKAFKCILVTLVPKIESPIGVNDFRPIAGCTTFYKIVTRIMTNRLGKVLTSIVSSSQGRLTDFM